ncbi:hypothetical protein [Streptomyces sp. NPDC001970]
MSQWRDGRTVAGDATSALIHALAELGIPERQYRHARPVVTCSGRPYVYLGLVPAEVVERIAEALGGAPTAEP